MILHKWEPGKFYPTFPNARYSRSRPGRFDCKHCDRPYDDPVHTTLETMKIWEVYHNGCDGRAPKSTIGFFAEEEMARSFESPYNTIREVEVYEGFCDKAHWEAEQKRQRALSKLSAEERKLLGI